MSDKLFAAAPPDIIAMSRESVDSLIRSCSGNAALLYLYILKNRGEFVKSEAAAALRLSERDIDSAVTSLMDAGLIQNAAAKAPRLQKDELPEYTIDDIRREMAGNTEFSQLVQEVQSSLGKILSSGDLLTLFGIYDSVGLPADVILYLISFCKSENQRRYGPGRNPTMRYIEKTAYTWEKEGIFSLEKAEEYVRQREIRRDIASRIKAALQIHGRQLSASEQRYVDGWIGMGFGEDAAEIAYDRTVLNTGKLSWSYINSIFRSWHEKGLHTAAEIERGDSKSAPAPSKAKQDVSTKNGSKAPTPSDIERMKRLLENMKKE